MDENVEGTQAPQSETEEGAKERMNRAREFAQQKYQDASSAVRNQYTAVRQKVDEVDVGEVTEKVREYVRANPGKALLISVAAGFAIGLMFRSSDED